MDERFEARVAVRIETAEFPPRALPLDENLSVGRAAQSGLFLGHAWVPSRLCRFIPFERGWVLLLGRARASVRNKYLGQVVFPGRAAVALQPGRTTILFPELDDELLLRVTIGIGQGEGLETLHDTDLRDAQRVGGEYVAHAVALSPTQRTVLAVVFRHLLLGRDRDAPTNLAKEAAPLLGKSEQAVKNVLVKVRESINEDRWMNLTRSDHLGQYLCRLTGTITLTDLPEHLR